MSKRKGDFGTPEKENKCPKTFGTPTASRSYRDEWKNSNPWLRYAMFCDFVFIYKIIAEDIEISD